MNATTPPPPGLRSLRVTDFRNHPAVSLDLSGAAVVLAGPNGAGKTNLLEAVSALAPGRGLRRASLEAIARIPTDADLQPPGPWAIAADLVDGEGGAVRIGVGQAPNNPTRRVVRIDGAAATHAEVAERLRVAWLTPAQDRVFTSPRGDRLAYFDRLVAGLEPTHAANAGRYERAMRERNRLLEEGRPDKAWVDSLEEEMAASGAAMARARVEAMQTVQDAIDARPDGHFPKAAITLDGTLEEDFKGGRMSEEAVAERFLQRLRRGRDRDGAAGRALAGVHRSDFSAFHRGKNMPAADCSTGEQKALLVGMSLAHGRVLRQSGQRQAALLLLDEAVAHLDLTRREALADELSALHAQTWLTGADVSLFAPFAGMAQAFAVEGPGNVHELELAGV